MDRSTSYKDKLSKGLSANLGLYSYPVLMASDILLFGGEIVPVGQDQKQHLEIARDIAIKFNNIYGDILIIPTEDIDEDTQLIPGIDGQKMSKSYNNIIPIFGDENFIKKQIMSIVTDSTPVDEPKDLDSPIYRLFSLFLNESDKQILENKFLFIVEKNKWPPFFVNLAQSLTISAGSGSSEGFLITISFLFLSITLYTTPGAVVIKSKSNSLLSLSVVTSR